METVDKIRSEAIWKDFNFTKGLIDEVKEFPLGDFHGLKEEAGVAVLEVLERQAEIYASDYKNGKARCPEFVVGVDLFTTRAHRFLWGYICAVTIEEMWQYFSVTEFKETGTDIIVPRWGVRNDPLQDIKNIALDKMANYDSITKNEWWKKSKY